MNEGGFHSLINLITVWWVCLNELSIISRVYKLFEDVERVNR